MPTYYLQFHLVPIFCINFQTYLPINSLISSPHLSGTIDYRKIPKIRVSQKEWRKVEKYTFHLHIVPIDPIGNDMY